MTRSCLPVLLLVFLLAGLPAPASAQDAVPAVLGGPGDVALREIADQGILDDAHFFSPQTIETARERIRQIRREYHCAVVVDTVASALPGDAKPRNRWWSRGPAPKINVDEWALRRAQALGVEGIYILICREPQHVSVVVWPERFEADLGPKQRLGLERLLIRQLKTTPDDTLLTALDHIHVALRARHEPTPPTADLWLLGVLLVGGVGSWVVLALVRLRLRKPQPFSFTGEPQTLGPTTGLLAGMFGTPAAYWITDRLFPQTGSATVETIGLEEEPPSETPAVAKDPGEEPLHGPFPDEPKPWAEHAEIK